MKQIFKLMRDKLESIHASMVKKYLSTPRQGAIITKGNKN